MSISIEDFNAFDLLDGYRQACPAVATLSARPDGGDDRCRRPARRIPSAANRARLRACSLDVLNGRTLESVFTSPPLIVTPSAASHSPDAADAVYRAVTAEPGRSGAARVRPEHPEVQGHRRYWAALVKKHTANTAQVETHFMHGVNPARFIRRPAAALEGNKLNVTALTSMIVQKAAPVPAGLWSDKALQELN
ncbi:hypothetical protein EVAR_23549_1 [Eumeta japonica]|uniref:Uncharacterized protein n=1 Tax=Eumeta variegata TaxID=151549 RepID=A0A4C1X081_EUMVA|nr:hypothetical protein EVAR_23549_1 [Eumeta japonica]